MTNEDVVRLIGRLTIDGEAARIRVDELEKELARRSNVVVMQPKAVANPPDGAPAPTEAAPSSPEETVEADPVPSQ